MITNNLIRISGNNSTSTVYIMGHTHEYKKQLDELIDILINKGKCEVYYHEDGLFGDILEIDDKKNLWCILCVSSALLCLDKAEDNTGYYSVQPGIADNLEFAQDDFIPVIPVLMDSVMTGVLSSFFKFEYSTSLLNGKYLWISNMYNLGKFGYIWRTNGKNKERCAMLTAFYMSHGVGYQKDKKKALEIEKEYYSSMFPTEDGENYKFLIDFQDNYAEIYGIEAFSKETKYLDDIEKCIREHGTPDVNSAMLMQHSVRNASKADPERIMRFCEVAVNQIVFVAKYGNDAEECISSSMSFVSSLLELGRYDLAKRLSDSFDSYINKRKAESKPDEWLQIGKLEEHILFVESMVESKSKEYEACVNKLDQRGEILKQVYELTKEEEYYFEYIIDICMMAEFSQYFDHDKAVSLFEKALNLYAMIWDKMSDFRDSKTKRKLLKMVDFSKKQLKTLKRTDDFDEKSIFVGKNEPGKGFEVNLGPKFKSKVPIVIADDKNAFAISLDEGWKLNSESWKELKVEPSFKSKNSIAKADVKNVFLISLDEEWEQICKNILNLYFVNIISPETNVDVSQYQMLCSSLAYVIVVIDHKFFEDSVAVNNVKYFVSKGIKILPIVIERDLLSDYNEILKRTEYVSAYDKEANKVLEAIDYYLKPVLTVLDSVEDRKERADSSFSHKIFLSYRKKDREYANKLIGKIYHLDNCWDTSVWFDDRLEVGEDYAKSIDNMLAGCDTVILLVTPSILEEKNYVKDVEYKKAIDYGKRIIPIEMVDTDRAALEEAYDSLGHIYSAEDLKDVLAFIKPGDRNDTNHCLRIAEAFDKGVNTSVNSEVAFDIYLNLAKQGIYNSMARVMVMYSKGIGVESDSAKAIYWCDKCINSLNNTVDKKDESSYENYIVQMGSLFAMTLGDLEEDYAINFVNQILDECKQYKEFFKIDSAMVNRLKEAFEELIEKDNNAEEEDQ